MSDYRGHIIAVLHYINQQVLKDWTGSEVDAFNKAMYKHILSKIACMSYRSFQFYFQLYLKESYGTYIDRIRIEYALQLLRDGDLSNAEISERIGFANDTAFYNALKKKYKLTPTQYKVDIGKIKLPKTIKLDYKIELSKEKHVLFLSYIGDYNNYSSSFFEEDSWDKLFDFASNNNIPLIQDEEYWGICYDNTDITESDKCRFYACLAINVYHSTKLTDKIKCMTIPSSLYAVFTHLGAYDDLPDFYNHAIQNIPPDYQLSEACILEKYINSPNDISEDQLITEVWIPIEKI